MKFASNIVKLAVAITITCLFSSTVLALPINYNESISGDLTEDPTVQLWAEAGTNTITGSVGLQFSSSEYHDPIDKFLLHVPFALNLSSVTVRINDFMFSSVAGWEVGQTNMSVAVYGMPYQTPLPGFYIPIITDYGATPLLGETVLSGLQLAITDSYSQLLFVIAGGSGSFGRSGSYVPFDGFLKTEYTFDIVVGDTTPVPEPSTFLLFGAGLGGFVLWRRRSKK